MIPLSSYVKMSWSPSYNPGAYFGLYLKITSSAIWLVFSWKVTYVAVTGRKCTLFRQNENRVQHGFSCHRAWSTQISIASAIAHSRDEVKPHPIWAFQYLQFLQAQQKNDWQDRDEGRFAFVDSLVHRPSRGGGRKAWYTLHAHAPLLFRFWIIRLCTDTVGYLHCKLFVF